MQNIKPKMNALLRDTDVMADVLGFLTRKMIALQLASFNRQFAALCHCWCQPEEEAVAENDAASVGDASALAMPASSATENGQKRKRKLNQGSKG